MTKSSQSSALTELGRSSSLGMAGESRGESKQPAGKISDDEWAMGSGREALGAQGGGRLRLAMG